MSQSSRLIELLDGLFEYKPMHGHPHCGYPFSQNYEPIVALWKAAAIILAAENYPLVARRFFSGGSDWAIALSK